MASTCNGATTARDELHHEYALSCNRKLEESKARKVGTAGLYPWTSSPSCPTKPSLSYRWILTRSPVLPCGISNAFLRSDILLQCLFFQTQCFCYCLFWLDSVTAFAEIFLFFEFRVFFLTRKKLELDSTRKPKTRTRIDSRKSRLDPALHLASGDGQRFWPWPMIWQSFFSHSLNNSRESKKSWNQKCTVGWDRKKVRFIFLDYLRFTIFPLF